MGLTGRDIPTDEENGNHTYDRRRGCTVPIRMETLTKSHRTTRNKIEIGLKTVKFYRSTVSAASGRHRFQSDAGKGLTVIPHKVVPYECSIENGLWCVDIPKTVKFYRATVSAVSGAFAFVRLG